ncbi:MAG: paraquat-inducible protein A [Pseudomonadota bacterium]
MGATIALLLLTSAFSLGLGLTLPLMQVEKLYFFTQTPSLLEVIGTTAQSGDWLITLAIALFSIVFPLTKLSVVFITAIARDASAPASPLFRWAGALSKWSMMDVLLVALVIFAAKTSGLASAVSQLGIWFYALSAVTGAVAAALLKRHLKDPDADWGR